MRASSAIISPHCSIGEGTQVWHFAQVREGASVGAGCILGKGVYVDAGVVIGDNVKIQNNVSIYRGVVIEDGVFIGPHVCFTNDKVPRSVNTDLTPKSPDDWQVSPTLVKVGASIGANATIVCGVIVGRWAMIAAGSVVTKDVADHALMMGVPARRRGWMRAERRMA